MLTSSEKKTRAKKRRKPKEKPPNFVENQETDADEPIAENTSPFVKSRAKKQGKNEEKSANNLQNGKNDTEQIAENVTPFVKSRAKKRRKKKEKAANNLQTGENDAEPTTENTSQFVKAGKVKTRKSHSKRNKYLHLVLAKEQANKINLENVESKTTESDKKKRIKNKRKRKIHKTEEEEEAEEQKLIPTVEIETKSSRKKRKIHKTEEEEAEEQKLIPAVEIETKSSRKKRKIDMNDPDEIRKQCNSRKTEVVNKLSGAQFRYLNEKLYTSTSEEAFNLFKEDPSLYDVYHKGYKIQISRWPDKPLDKIVKEIKSSPKSFVVADFGCGDANLAKRIQNTVHSFDLVATNERVTACDMAHVPLEKQCVDIAVFCLSLMGTNFVDYLVEANRVLKFNGLLKIAEVKSRFKSTVTFTKIIQRLGFKLLDMDESPKMFVYFNFKKLNGVTKDKIPKMKLLPCLYKNR